MHKAANGCLLTWLFIHTGEDSCIKDADQFQGQLKF